MSWQLGSGAILALALAAGFAWYERSRPDGRLVALVATLAAFAALGRIAFAALPNVKPTTDIVLISGYALGAGPGFMVGALAGLSSNFFFGQGPWTPWQMAGWGASGIVGAWLALAWGRGAGRRPPGRWPLAVVCALVGFAFTALQDVGDWVTYSDHSSTQLGVYVGKGLGFDAVHAGGCLLFALTFGPALARQLARFTQRLEVTWRPAPATDGEGTVEERDHVSRFSTTPLRPRAVYARPVEERDHVSRFSTTGLAGLLVAATVAGWLGELGAAGAFGTAGARAAAGVRAPVAYLLHAQNPDGGFGAAPGQPSSPLFSGWAALGLASAGISPNQVSRDGHSLAAYLLRGDGRDPGSLERTILALRAGGLPAGPELAALRQAIRRDGSVSDQVNLTAFAVLALRAAGAPVPSTTIAWLAAQRDSDGGFNYAIGGGLSDVDDTGAALEALAAVSTPQAAIDRRRAVAFILGHQNRDGGFPASPGAGSNAQSTAWAIQGLVAAGAAGTAVDRAVAYLDGLIGADGHIDYARDSEQTPVWVTAEALMGLERKPLPLVPVTGGGTANTGPVARSQARVRPGGSGRAAGGEPSAESRRGRLRGVPIQPTAMILSADLGALAAIALAPVNL